MLQLPSAPVKYTWIKAIKCRFFQYWPGITTQAVNKRFPQSHEATTKRHMDQTIKNIRTTQPRANQPTLEQETDPQQEPWDHPTNLCDHYGNWKSYTN
jgi:hypothetical protein